MNGLKEIMMPYLSQLYKVGKISIKYISQITGIHHTDVISLIAKNIEEIDVDPDLIKYSEEIGKKLSPYLKEAKDKGIILKGTINQGFSQ